MAENSCTGTGPRTFYERVQAAMKARNDEQEAASAKRAFGNQNKQKADVNDKSAVRVEQPRGLRPTVDAFSPTAKKAGEINMINKESLQSLHDRPITKRTAISISSPKVSHLSSVTNMGGVALDSSDQARSTEDQIERLKATNLAATSSNIFGANKRAASSQLDPVMESTTQSKTSPGLDTLVNKSTLQSAPHLRGTRVTNTPQSTANPLDAASPDIAAGSSVGIGPHVFRPNVIHGQFKGPQDTDTAASRYPANSPQVTAPHRKMVKLNHDPDSTKPIISGSTVLKSSGITSDPVTDHVRAEECEEASKEKGNSRVKTEDSAAVDRIKTEDGSEPAALTFTFTTPGTQSKDDGKVSTSTPVPNTTYSASSVEAVRASTKAPICESPPIKESTSNNTPEDTSGSVSTENNAATGTTFEKHTLNDARTSGNGIIIGAAHSNANGPYKALSKPADLTTVIDKFGLQEVVTENTFQRLIKELDEIRDHQRLANTLLASHAERFSAMEWRIQELERSTVNGELKSRVLPVVVEFPNGAILQLEASPHMKMSELLQKVRSKTGREFIYCEFVHSNIVLMTEKRIGDYEIKAGDTLFLRRQSDSSKPA